jgi:hypothetical protein
MGPFLGCLFPPLPFPDLQEDDNIIVSNNNDIIFLMLTLNYFEPFGELGCQG